MASANSEKEQTERQLIRAISQKSCYFKAQMTSLSNYVKKFQNTTREQLKLNEKIIRLRTLFDKFNQNQDELALLTNDYDKIETQREEIIDQYDDVLSAALEVQALFKVIPDKQSNNENTNESQTYPKAAQMNVKLPKIDLPKFNGRMEKWITFKDAFLTMIHSQSGLSNIQKLNYLKLSLTDKAETAISAFTICDENYEIAWNHLVEIYDNKRALVLRHAALLRDTPSMSNDSSEAIRDLVNYMQLHIRSLQALGRTWEDIANDLLISILVTRMGRDTRKNWEHTLSDTEMPKLLDVFKYLHIASHQSREDEPVPQSPKGNVPSRPVTRLQTANRGNHKTFQCKHFDKMNVDKRIEAVKNAKHCLNCLAPGHTAEQCNASKCRVCNLPHNTRLHKDSRPQFQKREERADSPKPGTEYNRIMDEYIDLGHMTQVKNNQDTHGYYLPHHAVIKPTSSTTKCRVVFDAIRCLQQLASEEFIHFPRACEVISKDIYVDDLLTGTDNYDETLRLRNDIILVLKRGGLNIRQWVSNDPNLLSGLSEEDIHPKFFGDTTVKTLGLLGPVTVVAKILMQRLWQLKVDWDESLPMSLQTEWSNYQEELSLLEDNPADLLSRGTTPRILINSKIWCNGPDWLATDESLWPASCFEPPPETPEMQLERANEIIIKSTQTNAFSEEIAALKSKAGLNPKSKLLSLNPFIDEQGILRAVHLEVVGDLTTDAFLAALKRFIARRGICSNIYSDNGTNFVGANNELNELHRVLREDERVNRFVSDKKISWHFMPTLSPHFGGLWEAAVKSFKHHLRRVVGDQLFTYEQFATFVTEIEGILNSRPLTPLSSDPNDPAALTPAHFLIGTAITSVPEADFTASPSNRLSNWQHIQKVKQDFWARWTKEYIHQLQTRTKWMKGSHDIQEGTVVILKDDHLPPLQWNLGRILEIHPGADNIIRAVTVKT
ncbi:uncharacterized protein LOC143364295, partial [Halictus rubicundus]|uniref:uncharacterized protein LOC143364295 n=1 Tax=Halictus rubicundus TaxID=77578 RepID=UPI004036159F